MFFQVQGPHAHVYILDERGSLFHQSVAFHDRQTLLVQFGQVLEAVRYRMRNSSMPNGLRDSEDVRYYQVGRENRNEYRLEALKPAQSPVKSAFMDVQVIGNLEDESRGGFSIFCGNREFSTLEYGDGLFQEVARHITLGRNSGAGYPTYITDIDISASLLAADPSDGVQTIHYLNYKKRIENLLNEALHKLRAE